MIVKNYDKNNKLFQLEKEVLDLKFIYSLIKMFKMSLDENLFRDTFDMQEVNIVNKLKNRKEN